jgi:hypothetical protein
MAISGKSSGTHAARTRDRQWATDALCRFTSNQRREQWSQLYRLPELPSSERGEHIGRSRTDQADPNPAMPPPDARDSDSEEVLWAGPRQAGRLR